MKNKIISDLGKFNSYIELYSYMIEKGYDEVIIYDPFSKLLDVNQVYFCAFNNDDF